MKDDKINNFIHQTCLSKGWSPGDLERAIDDAIVEHRLNLAVRDKSTINKWYNGKQTPGPEYYRAIALALGVSEDELRSGKKLNTKVLEDTIAELQSLYSAELAEKESAIELLWMGKRNHRFFAYLLVTWGVYLMNASFLRNFWIYLICYCLIFALFRYAYSKQKKETGDAEKKSFLVSIRDELISDFKFIKFTFGTSLLARTSSLCLMIVVILAFMPLIESFFYKGQFALSATIYIYIGLIMMFRSFKKE